MIAMTDEELGRKIWAAQYGPLCTEEFYAGLGQAARAAMPKSRIEGMSEQDIKQEMLNQRVHIRPSEDWITLCAQIVYRLAHEPAKDLDQEAKRINGIWMRAQFPDEQKSDDILWLCAPPWQKEGARAVAQSFKLTKQVNG